jgi:two-component system cell cycle sensor histidine kinase/response regulator CckA
MDPFRRITRIVDLLAGSVAVASALLPPTMYLLFSYRAFAESGVHPPLWPLLAKALLAALAGMLLGYAVFRLIRSFPLRMLDRARESLFRERELTRMALQCIDHAVIVTGPGGVVEMINQGAEKLTEWAQQEARGRPLWEVFHTIHGQTRASLASPIKRVLKQGEPVTLADDTVLVSRNGTERLIGARAAPVRDPSGAVVGAVLVFLDRTGKREMDEELIKSEKLESVGALAGGIAHDFNNILTAIMGNISLALMNRADGETAFTKVEEARKACLRARELTMQFLAFSRGGAPVREVCSIADILRESVGLALTGSRSRCAYSIPEDIFAVEVDRGQISQVIQNLVLNADQAMPQGGVIRVEAENVPVIAPGMLPLDPGDHVRISVRDTGCGIQRKNLKKVFDPYFTTKNRGNGLGLSTSYFIIKNHKGHIEVESAVGVGTAFHVYLPATRNLSWTVPEADLQPAVGEGRILIMDDEEGVRNVAGELLNHVGYATEYARDGVEAVGMFEKAAADGRPFDAVILDLTIPGGMGGKDTIKKLLEVAPDVKAIVSSGYSSDPVMANYAAFGFKGVVPKPYRFEELSRVLHEVITASTPAISKASSSGTA